MNEEEMSDLLENMRASRLELSKLREEVGQIKRQVTVLLEMTVRLDNLGEQNPLAAWTRK